MAAADGVLVGQGSQFIAPCEWICAVRLPRSLP